MEYIEDYLRKKKFDGYWSDATIQVMNTEELVDTLQMEAEKTRSYKGLLKYVICAVMYFVISFQLNGDPELQGMGESGFRQTFIEGTWEPYGMHTADDVRNLDDVMTWMKQVWAPAIWPNNTPPADGEYYLTNLNRIVRSPIVAQIRSDPDAPLCQIFSNKSLSTPYQQCHPQGGGSFLGFSDVGSSPFGQNTTYTKNLREKYALVFKLFDNPDENPVGCAECPSCCFRVRTLQDAIAQIDRINDTDFFDAQTQWIAIYMDVQNAVVGGFTHMRLVFAQEPAGIVTPVALPFLSWNSWYGTLIFGYSTNPLAKPINYFWIILVIFFGLIAIFVLARMFRKLYRSAVKQGIRFMDFFVETISFWDYYDFLMSSLILATVLTYLASWGQTYHIRNLKTMDTVDVNSSFYFSIPLNYCLIAMSELMLTIRSFGFFHLHPKLNFVSRTMSLAFSDLKHFSIVFFVIITGFALAGWYFWGHGSSHYRGFVESMKSVLTFSLGQFDLETLRPVDTSFGIMLFIYYFVLMIIVFFVLINIFLAIILNAYEEAVDLQREQERKMPPKGFRRFWFPLLLPNFPSEENIIKKLIAVGIIEKVAATPIRTTSIRFDTGNKMRIRLPVLPRRQTLKGGENPNGVVPALGSSSSRAGYSNNNNNNNNNSPDGSTHGEHTVISIRLPTYIVLRSQVRQATIFSPLGVEIIQPSHILLRHHEITVAVHRHVEDGWIEAGLSHVVFEFFQATTHDVEGNLGAYQVQRTQRGNIHVMPIPTINDNAPAVVHVLSKQFNFNSGEFAFKETLTDIELRALLTQGTPPLYEHSFVKEVLNDLTKRRARTQFATGSTARHQQQEKEAEQRAAIQHARNAVLKQAKKLSEQVEDLNARVNMLMLKDDDGGGNRGAKQPNAAKPGIDPRDQVPIIIASSAAPPSIRSRAGHSNASSIKKATSNASSINSVTDPPSPSNNSHHSAFMYFPTKHSASSLSFPLNRPPGDSFNNSNDDNEMEDLEDLEDDEVELDGSNSTRTLLAQKYQQQQQQQRQQQQPPSHSNVVVRTTFPLNHVDIGSEQDDDDELLSASSSSSSGNTSPRENILPHKITYC